MTLTGFKMPHGLPVVLMALTVLVAWQEPVCAAGYPSKPIRLIVPYAPGGGNDTMARIIGKKLTDSWNQQVVVDNRPGANGVLACVMTANAAPDGHTLLMANISSHGTNPALYTKLPYDALRDFAPVILLASAPNVLVVRPAMPVKTLKDLIGVSRARSRELTYGSNGNGSSQHLAGELFASAFSLKLVHVPYKGTAPVMIDLLAGQIDLTFGNIVGALPYIRANRLVPVAVTSLQRSAALPDVPAIAETVPGFEAAAWWGLVAPRHTPARIVDVLNREILNHLAAADTKEQFSRQGMEPRNTTPQQFAEFISAEVVKWTKVVKDAGIRLE